MVMAQGRPWKGIVCDTCVRERKKRLMLNFFKKPVRAHTDTAIMFLCMHLPFIGMAREGSRLLLKKTAAVGNMLSAGCFKLSLYG